MNPFTVRRVVAAGLIGLTTSLLAVPASAQEVDEDEVAARLCPAGASFYEVDSAEQDDRAEVAVYSYEVDGPDGELTSLCTFAIISTDEDATLDGSYVLSVGAARVAGAVSGSESVTAPVLTSAGQSPGAVFAATGRQLTTDVKKASPATKKAARKTLDRAKKKYRKAYAKAGRTPRAKKLMVKKVAAATRRYKASIATRETVTKRPYSLDLTVPLDRPQDEGDS